MNLLAVVIALLSPGTVKDMGYCPDVSSAECAVRDYWPLDAGDPTGVDAYWFLNTDNEVCFTTRANYVRAMFGTMRGTDDCIWRRRRGI